MTNPAFTLPELTRAKLPPSQVSRLQVIIFLYLVGSGPNFLKNETKLVNLSVSLSAIGHFFQFFFLALDDSEVSFISVSKYTATTTQPSDLKGVKKKNEF